MSVKLDKLEGFEVVPHDEFYRVVGPMNVHPSPQGPWSDDYGYDTYWKTPSGDVVGVSDSFAGGRYWLKRTKRGAGD